MIVLYALSIISVCAIIFAIFRIKRSRFLHLMNKLPGPKRYPVVGNFPDLICEDGIENNIVLVFSWITRMILILEVFFKRVREWGTLYGPVYNISCCYFPTVNITDAEEFEVSSNSINNFFFVIPFLIS